MEKQLERLEKLMVQMLEMQGKQNADMADMNTRFDQVNARLDKMDSKLDVLDVRLRIMNDIQTAVWRKTLPEYVPTEEERQAIDRAREEMERGEFTRYNSFEELELDIMNDDEEDDDKEA